MVPLYKLLYVTQFVYKHTIMRKVFWEKTFGARKALQAAMPSLREESSPNTSSSERIYVALKVKLTWRMVLPIGRVSEGMQKESRSEAKKNSNRNITCIVKVSKWYNITHSIFMNVHLLHMHGKDRKPKTSYTTIGNVLFDELSRLYFSTRKDSHIEHG